MNDTISRKAAIDIYDDYNIAVENGELEAYGRYRKQLCNLPSAQPEIIRCKDCKQFRRWIDTDICFCDITESERTEDDFCSRAERRNGTNE